MSPPSGLLVEFFSQFNFQSYTYDPHNPALEEFERLCQARRWGAAKIREHEAAFLLVLEREDLITNFAGPQVIEFFRKYEYSLFTYNSDVPALLEFQRLVGLRGWGEVRLLSVTKQFTDALLSDVRELSLYLPSEPTAPENLGMLDEFFTQFNFQNYIYDPHNPALEEFERLCQARRWGAAKIREHKAAFLLAVEREDLRGNFAGPQVINFFRKYEYSRFTYNPDVPGPLEFQRLVELRGWGEARLLKVTKQFTDALLSDVGELSLYLPSEPTDSEDLGTPEVDILADWLRKQECPGYRYGGDLPELEFRRLVRVKEKKWYGGTNRRKGGMSAVGRGPWKGSTEFTSLRTEFYGLVEEVFNSLLSRFCLITGLMPWQVLVGLYGQGQQNVGKHAAKTILKKVFINIFDFLDAFKELLKNPPTTDSKKLLRLLRPSAVELQFPNNRMLGVYSALTNRVFPIDAVNKDGTLVLLLQPIILYLESFEDLIRDFEEEAGDELPEAEEEGRAAVRSLLLSREWDCLFPLGSEQ